MLCIDEFTNRIVGREQYNEFIFVDVPRPASESIPSRSMKVEIRGNMFLLGHYSVFTWASVFVQPLQHPFGLFESDRVCFGDCVENRCTLPPCVYTTEIFHGALVYGDCVEDRCTDPLCVCTPEISH